MVGFKFKFNMYFPRINEIWVILKVKSKIEGIHYILDHRGNKVTVSSMLYIHKAMFLKMYIS